jgi:hypothetical protein
MSEVGLRPSPREGNCTWRKEESEDRSYASARQAGKESEVNVPHWKGRANRPTPSECAASREGLPSPEIDTSAFFHRSTRQVEMAHLRQHPLVAGSG